MIQNIKQKMQFVFAPVLVVAALVAPLLSTPVYAVDTSCGTETAILHCPNTVTPGTDDLKNTGVWGILLIAIGILTAGIGVAALAGIVYGIIMYTLSQGDPGRIKKALEIIRNVIIGIAAYALMWSALNWLIPGGVFN